MFKHRYKFFFIAFLAIYSFLNIIVLEGDRLFQAELPKTYLLYIIVFLCIAVWFANLTIEIYLLRKFENIHPLLLQFGASIIAVLIICLVSVELTELILGYPFNFTRQNFLLTAGFTFRINLFLNSINAIYFFSQKYKEKAVEAEKLKTLNSTARYEMLNHQINPHFFFNNLNSLSTLIHHNPQLADKYLQKLSDIYRYIIKNKDNELVSLSEELHFLNDYIDLLSIRFKDALTFQVEINPKAEKKFLPPAVLQLLVENVVKHNYFTKNEPLVVFISAEAETIVIKNKIQKKQVVEISSGIGLQNISERYQFLGKMVKIADQEGEFRVEVPLIMI